MQIKTSLLLIIIIDLMAALFTTPYAIHVEIVEGSGMIPSRFVNFFNILRCDELKQ